MTRLLKILLLVSLAFNAAFVVGYLSRSLSAAPADTPEAAAELVSRKLDLDERQRQAFLALRKESHSRKRELRQAIALARERLVAEQCKPQPDPNTIRALKTDLNELRQTYRDLSFHQTNRFLKLLKPKQRRRVHDLLSKHGQPGGLDEQFLQQYDEDRDGQISPQEYSKLIRATRDHAKKPRGGRTGKTRSGADGDGPRQPRVDQEATQPVKETQPRTPEPSEDVR